MAAKPCCSLIAANEAAIESRRGASAATTAAAIRAANLPVRLDCAPAGVTALDAGAAAGRPNHRECALLGIALQPLVERRPLGAEILLLVPGRQPHLVAVDHLQHDLRGNLRVPGDAVAPVYVGFAEMKRRHVDCFAFCHFDLASWGLQ